MEHFVNELASDLIPELEFDENFVLVDKDDLCSGSEFHGARISHKVLPPAIALVLYFCIRCMSPSFCLCMFSHVFTVCLEVAVLRAN